MLWKGIYIFALRPDCCIFSTLPLDVENTVTRTQSLKVTVSVGGEGLILFILSFKVAVSVGSGFMLLFCVRGYCIFSTLPLDVENTVIYTQNLKVTVLKCDV